ncbi:uracil-DNA glycosylase [Roseinatronobacter monicus]|uniref:Type-4 uracil-DNA glycosylase n=1 Tax=Roseinatronobacter monicus TaxID=393481 RepID=A0A543KF67_9RHOB|nr:uracil-DNA glycosylase [Roseinatronobacter monicus]TQM93725.1 DNA polymerase [Roseinatronobacter monicus]
MNAPATWETDWHVARACLDWQVEMGVVEGICDAPVNRYALDPAPVVAPKAEAPKSAKLPPASPPVQKADPVGEAQAMAEAAPDLEALQAALADFPHSELKRGARNLVFCDGQPEARVMIVGEAPGREEDRQGKPFIGEAGQLLDRMLAAINMRRDHPDPASSVYITNILPWRPPQNRDPSPDERAMFRPFVMRHIELINPDILILMGRISAITLLHSNEAITRIRGQWREVAGRPALPMLHPAYLLRNLAAKREAWADLLDLQARLRTLP